MKIAVIGAGISGLSFAKYCKIYRKDWEVKVFESLSSHGGIAKVKMIDGIPFHMVGGHCFNSKFQDVKDFVFEHVLPESEWNKVDRNASILFEGQKISYPIEYSIKDIYKYNPKLATSIIKDFISAKRESADNLGDWFINNFGKTLAEKYFIPYNTKIWNCDPFKMSADWVSDKLPMPNLEEFIKGFFESGKDLMPHASFYYPKSGTQNTFIDQLAANLEITYNTSIGSIKMKKNGTVEINGDVYDKVIYTGPLDRVFDLVENVTEEVTSAARSLKFNRVTTVLWESEDTEDTWTYSPASDLLFHRLIHIGNFVGSKKNYTITEAVGEQSYQDMIDSGAKLDMLRKPLDYNISERAYVVFDKDINANKKIIFDYFESSNIHLLGRFGEWEYYNMDICIKKAMELCEILGK